MLCYYGCGLKSKGILKNGVGCCRLDPVLCKNGRKLFIDALRNFSLDKDISILYKEVFGMELLVDPRKNRTLIKSSLIEAGIFENKCEICGITEYNKKPIQFHLHHINGNNTENSISNLSLLCPNCHSQTESYGRAKSAKRIQLNDDELVLLLENNFTIQDVIKNPGNTGIDKIEPSRLYIYIKKLLLVRKTFVGKNLLSDLEVETLLQNTKGSQIKKKISKETSQRIELLQNSGIDFHSRGWCNEVGKYLKLSPQAAARWIRRHAKKLLE